MATWEESKSNLRDLVQVLKEDDSEAKAITDLTAAILDLSASFEGGFVDVRTSIRALGRRVESAEHAATNTGDLKRLDDAIRDEKRAKATAITRLQQILDERSSAQARAGALRQAAEEAREASQRARAARDEAMPRLRHSMSLYAAASHIRFDSGAPSGTVKGVVAPPAGGEGAGPLAFDLAPGAEGLSAVDVADRLWELIGASTGVMEDIR